MRPFPKREDYDGASASFIKDGNYVYYDAASYERTRADWYASEIVPLLREARNAILRIRPIAPVGLIGSINAALKACEADHE